MGGSELLFAPKPRDWAPYAYLHLGNSVAYTVDEKALTITFTGLPKADSGQKNQRRAPNHAIGSVAVAAASEAEANAAASPLETIFLLQDGRWQVLEVQQLQIQVPDKDHLGKWLFGVSKRC